MSFKLKLLTIAVIIISKAFVFNINECNNLEVKLKPIIAASEKNKNLSRLVVEKIKQAIINKEILPGEILPSESEMVRDLGVSKSSVREAIKMLEAIGIVEIKRGVGTVLSQNPMAGYINIMVFQTLFNGGDNKQLIEFRRMFELAYTEIAINNATDEDKKKMQESIDMYEKAIANKKYCADEDIFFHTCVLEATHNSFIISLGKAVNELFITHIENSIKTKPEIALRDHKAIFNAIQESDNEKAKLAIEQSIRGWSLQF